MLMNIASGKREKSHKHVEKCFQVLIVLAALRCAILTRNLPIGSDGLSYLDVARSYLRHDWCSALNGYWGPLYPLLVAGWLKVVHPSNAQEFAAVRGLNFLIFIFCFYSFVRIWHALHEWNREQSESGCRLPTAFPLGWMILGYALFAVNVLWFVDLVGPDILVGSIVLLVSSRVLELHDRKTTLMGDVGLGLLLAAGYYIKAILFFFALAVLCCLVIGSLVLHGFRSRQCRGAIVAALVCILVVTPHVIALSRLLGHFSVGETGRLNYAWFVDGTETGAWADGGASFPFFPGTMVLDAPRVFAIPQLAGVTYAPWYDAARFDKHSRAMFNVRGQVRQISVNSKSLADELIGRHSALLVALLILASAAPALFVRRLAAAWFCIVPTIFVTGLYLLVHLVSRFMIGFSLVMWGILFACIHVPANYQVLMRRAFACGIAVFAACTLPGMAHFLISQPQNLLLRDLIIAAEMPNYGIKTGDAVGVIGDGQVAYWAHWAQVSIVSEVASMDSASFWSSSHASQQAAVRSMAALGAKAVIWRRDSESACPQDWIELPARPGCIIVNH